MNQLVTLCDSDRAETQQHHDAEYICVRVVDTLMREDVRQCVSRGEIVDISQLPAAMSTSFAHNPLWLRIAHFGAGQLWIPVAPCNFMQPWRLAQLPLIWCDAAGYRPLYEIAEILACFRSGLSAAEARGFLEFEAECQQALDHRRACETEREQWFRHWRARHGKSCGADLPEWNARLVHYDRLAAFHDHPFYPTARAKLGFSSEDLHLYAPEFQPTLLLNWLAIPSNLYQQTGDSLPAGWPGFSAVGLDECLARTHRLLPVHPFVWQHQLERLLQESGLADQVVRAPRSALQLTPTLSVRTLVLCESPAWHVKLPLTIRTLGGRNIRTIKPSTIVDGHCIQSLLAAIVEREPELQHRILLTEESTGAHVANQPFLGFIVRHYPEEQLHGATLVPIAALSADTPADQPVVMELIARFFGGDWVAFLDEYFTLTLRFHLSLWLRYGIALESNQQNSVLVLSDSLPRLRLLLKDNDAARIHRAGLCSRWPALAGHVAGLQDRRIFVDDELPLAQMFITITLQLNIATLIETVARLCKLEVACLYAMLRQRIESTLAQLAADNADIALARAVLLEADCLPVKYLLTAATLVDKQTTGAADVNKYYGHSAPNFLRQPL